MSLSRSGQAPLDVDIMFTTEGSSKSTYTMIFNEYHRFNRLSIDFDDKLEHYPPEWELVLPFMSRSAPMLQALHLVIAGHTDPLPQLDDLLKGCAPRLRELYIRGDGVPLLSFNSLRVLDFNIALTCDNYKKSYENLLVLLMANPQLESLTFDVDLPDFPIYPHQPPVNLPKLKNLVVRTTQLRLPDVLEGLVVPPDTRRLSEMYEYEPDESLVFDAPVELLEIKVDIDTCAVSAVQLKYDETFLFSDDSCAGSRPPFVLEDSILSEYDLSNITFFRMKFYDETELHLNKTDYESFKKIFRSLTGLRSLDIEHWDRDVEQAEEPEMPYLDGLMDPVGSDVSSLPCPLLVELRITHPTASLSYANQLKRCILVRLDASCPFSDGITLYGCTKLSSEVRTLLDGLVEWEELEEDES